MRKMVLFLGLMTFGCEEVPTYTKVVSVTDGGSGSNSGDNTDSLGDAGNCNGTNNCNTYNNYYNDNNNPTPPAVDMAQPVSKPDMSKPMDNEHCKVVCEEKHYNCQKHCGCDEDRRKCDDERKVCYVVCDRDCR